MRAIILVLLVGWQFVCQSQSEAPVRNKESERLHAIFDREWDYTMEQNPTWASHLGDRRWNDRWPDKSFEAIRARHEHAKAVLDELKTIDRAKLPPEDQLNLDLFRRQYERSIEEHGYRLYLIPLTQRDGIQTADELADALRFETVRDYEDWIARLRAFPRLVEQTTALMREGIRQGMLQPKIVMQRVPGQIEKQIVEDPEQSPFYKPFQHFPAAIAEPERERLREQARAAIASGVVGEFKKFQQFFNTDYLPACFDQVGAWQLPRGENLYGYLARRFTTTLLTPEEIHRIGLREVERIRSEMQRIMKQSGFEGDLPEFFHFLRTDPQFYCSTKEELLEEYRAVSKRIDPTIVRLFKTLPRMPYGVEAIPDKIAPDTTTAYYRQPAADGSRAGSYFVNLYKPESRPRWEMMALSIHEAVPGHHLQIALALEQQNLPRFRRVLETTAYVEGWALYAESLGDELGLYDDPYSKFGQLTYEMWRAVRLVVDTGMHSLRWSRGQAIEFFRKHAPKTHQDIVNEIDRYIAWPGQALAYKIGELKIKELRARAEERLGDRFDVRAFHDAVLLNGAMPLDLLEERIEGWIDERLAGE